MIDVDQLQEPVRVRTSESWSAFARLRGQSRAVYSQCSTYRYLLERTWDRRLPRRLVFVGLNPSTATENVDDPTIRKLIGFADRWGLGGLTMLNYFAFRSTDPRGLPEDANEAAGPLNDEVLDMVLKAVREDEHVLAFGWGVHVTTTVNAPFRSVALRIKCQRIGVVPKCFGVTKNGQPKHPLYLANETKLIDYEW